MKKVNEVFFSIQNADTEKRLVSGVSDSGEPNGSGLLLDYETSKPNLIAWSEGISKKTKGRSKGVLRVMHQLENVGHIVSLEFDDDARKILVTVYVSDDKTWEKIQAGDYTGFSWWWRTQGMPWKNDEASEIYGKPIHSYTGKPIELSIVDAACVPGSDFTLIQNADFPEEEEMAEEITDPPQELVAQDPSAEVIAPENPPEVVAPPAETDVKNGMYTAGRFGEALENLHWLIKATEAEEKMEGEAASIPEELKAGLRALAEPVAKYMVAQVKELVGGEDVDMFAIDDDDDFADVEAIPEEDVKNGDYPGHPFHGNQHVGGSGGRSSKASGSASHLAHRASVAAHSGGSHNKAASAHRAAAKAAAAAGRKKVAAYHKAQAEHHSVMHKIMQGDKTGYQNADGGDVHNAESPDLADLKARIEALESLSVKNAEAPPAPSAPPAPILRTVTQEMDAGIEVKNADAEPSLDPVKVEAQRILALPESKRLEEVVKTKLRGL